MVIVSSCLAGVECRYNGKSFLVPAVVEMVKRGIALPICPEMLAGLPVPRQPAEQRGQKVISKDGSDVTEKYFLGAQMALNIALAIDCKRVILKSKSPTCGCGFIYDGFFSECLIPGDGIFTKLLKARNIEVATEEQFVGK